MHAPVAAPGAGLRAPPGTPNSYRRLLPKLRLAPTYESPAEEANQSTNNSYHGHRDARNGTRGKVGITIASSAIPHEQQRTASAAGGSQLLAYISTHLCAGSASSTAGQEMHPGAPKTLGCLPRRYVCIHMHKHMEQQLGRDRSAGRVARRHSAPRGRAPRPQGSTALCGSEGPGGPRGTRYRPHAI